MDKFMSSRPIRNVAPVDYGGQDEDGGEVTEPGKKKRKADDDGDNSIFADMGFPCSSKSIKQQGEAMAAIFAGSRGGEPETSSAGTKITPIFAPSPITGGAVAKKPAPKPKAGSKLKSAGGGYEMQRRALGDAVKANISVEKWCIGARCHCTTSATLDVFRNLIAPNAAEVTPATFDASTPVVVAAIRSSASAGEIFGKTKITGGTRMGSWSANKMELVFFPPTGQLRCWWTMQ
jgi:hypothetical protein